MAKGLRASVNKRNNKTLRNRVFGPVEQARTERLSAKLLELAAQPRPERQEMEVDTEEAPKQDDSLPQEQQQAEEMDIDGAPATKSTTTKSRRKASAGRVQKKGRGKPRNEISFPKYKGKGALKPFSQSKRKGPRI